MRSASVAQLHNSMLAPELQLAEADINLLTCPGPAFTRHLDQRVACLIYLTMYLE